MIYNKQLYYQKLLLYENKKNTFNQIPKMQTYSIFNDINTKSPTLSGRTFVTKILFGTIM